MQWFLIISLHGQQDFGTFGISTTYKNLDSNAFSPQNRD